MGWPSARLPKSIVPDHLEGDRGAFKTNFNGAVASVSAADGLEFRDTYKYKRNKIHR